MEGVNQANDIDEELVSVHSNIRRIDNDLLTKITGIPLKKLSKLHILDLHLRHSNDGKIVKIENLNHLTPNLRQLNLSYNAIRKIEGLSRLHNLIELNLAENAITKIENLENLQLLERLNLSGNKIQRIPESMGLLHNLNHLRLARNELSVMEDLIYLSSLEKLIKLRIDENPFSMNEITEWYAIFHIPSLTILNGKNISSDDRLEANQIFIGTTPTSPDVEVLALRQQLSDELYKLSKVKQEIRDNSPSKLVSNPNYLPMEPSDEMDNNRNQILALRLQQYESIRSEVNRLRHEIESYRISTSSPPTQGRPVGATDTESDTVPSQIMNHQRIRFLNNRNSSVQMSSSWNEFKTSEGLVTPPPPPTYPTPSTSKMNDSFRTSINHSRHHDAMGSHTETPQRSITPPKLLDIATKQVTELNARIENLTSKLLTSEREKTQLQNAFTKLKNETENNENSVQFFKEEIDLLKDELRIKSIDLQNISKKLQDTEEEKKRLEVEFKKMKEDFSQRINIQTNEKKERRNLRDENLKLQNELKRLRDMIVSNNSSSTMLDERERYPGGVNATNATSVVDTKRQQATRVEVMEQRVTIDEMNQKNQRLSKELDVVQSQLVMNKGLLEAVRHENDELQSKLRYQEEVNNLQRVNMEELEREKMTVENERNELKQLNTTLMRERDHYQYQCRLLEEDLRAYLNVKKPSDGTSKAGGSTFRYEGNKKPSVSKSTYFEVTSISSSDEGGEMASKVDYHRRSVKDRSQVVATQPTSPRITSEREIKVKPSVGVSQLELMAAESMAHMLLEELNNSMKPIKTKPSSTGFSGNPVSPTGTRKAVEVVVDHLRQQQSLKEACVRAALRLVSTSTSMIRELDIEEEEAEEEEKEEEEEEMFRGGADQEDDFVLMDHQDYPHLSPIAPIRSQPIAMSTPTPSSSRMSSSRKAALKKRQATMKYLPLQALGDRRFLSKIVAETQAGLIDIEDSNQLKQEIKQLEVIGKELGSQSQQLEQTIQSKTLTLQTLHKHAIEAEEKAKEALESVEYHTKRLESLRDDISRAEMECHVVRREVEIGRHQVQENVTLNEMEQLNLNNIRNKMVEMKNESNQLEQALQRCRTEVMNEEGKLRMVKSTATDQLRLIQSDVQKLQQEVTSKQKVLEMLEKSRWSLEEEGEIRRREGESQLAGVQQSLDEGRRQLNELQTEVRVQRMECEQILNRRRQVENELRQCEEKLQLELSKMNSEEMSYRRKVEQNDRVLKETEQTVRMMKEKVKGYETESMSLQRTVDELRQQQIELTHQVTTRKQNLEEELSQNQQQNQLLQRNNRQLNQQIVQKQREVDVLTTELRSLERRSDEIKQFVEENNTNFYYEKEKLKSLQNENKKLSEKNEELKNNEKFLLQQSTLLKMTIEQENKLMEEIHQKLINTKKEENNEKECEIKLKNNLKLLNIQMEENQMKLNNDRQQIEKEKQIIFELKNKKLNLESNIQQLEDKLKFIQDRMTQGNIEKIYDDQSIVRINDELNQFNKELYIVMKRVDDIKFKEEIMKQNQIELKLLNEKLKKEIEGKQFIISEEKNKINELYEESKELIQQTNHKKEEINEINLKKNEIEMEYEKIKKEIFNFEEIKNKILNEINYLRELNKMEQQRIDKGEGTYDEIQRRYQELVDKLHVKEKNYEELKLLHEKEEEKIKLQQKKYTSTLEEMKELEGTIHKLKLQLVEERSHALLEIGKLNQIKQLTQQQLIFMDESVQQVNKRKEKVLTMMQSSPYDVTDHGVSSHQTRNYSRKGHEEIYSSGMMVESTSVPLLPPPRHHGTVDRDEEVIDLNTLQKEMQELMYQSAEVFRQHNESRME